MTAQDLDALWSKRMRREATQSRMSRSVKEEHLLHHDLCDRVQGSKANRGELFRRRSALGGVVVEHRHNILVSGHYPGVQKRIPVNWIFSSESVKKRIGIGEDRRVEQLVEAQRGH